MKMVHALGQKWEAEYQYLPKEEQDAVLESMASPQGLCARQRFGGHNENTGYATSLRRAMGSLRVRNSPGESRFRSEEHTSELQSLMRISYAVFCLKKKKYHAAQKVRTAHKNQKYIKPTQSEYHNKFTYNIT